MSETYVCVCGRVVEGRYRTYDEVVKLVHDEFQQFTTMNRAYPALIELSDHDYDAVVVNTKWYDPNTDEVKPLSLKDTPRDGGTLLGIQARANPCLTLGEVRVT